MEKLFTDLHTAPSPIEGQNWANKTTHALWRAESMINNKYIITTAKERGAAMPNFVPYCCYSTTQPIRLLARVAGRVTGFHLTPTTQLHT
jgi:hypothetical protein